MAGFESGARFSTEAWNHKSRQMVTVFGTVLHRRDMYGVADGGTYKVEYDTVDRDIHVTTEHNANGNDMVSIVADANTEWYSHPSVYSRRAKERL
jgi:hypothetical protein